MSRKTIPVNYDLQKNNDACIRLVKILMEESRAMLIRHGETIDSANRLSRGFVIDLCHHLGGVLFYLKKQYYANKKELSKTVKSRLEQGEKIENLADEYGISTRRIYQIKKAVIDELPVTDKNEANCAFALTAARMLIKSGVSHQDAVSAARGLIAVVAARVGGHTVYIPIKKTARGILNQLEIYQAFQAGKSIRQLAAAYSMPTEEITTMINNIPVFIPSSSDFPAIRTRLLDVAGRFKDFEEVSILIGDAVERIGRAERIIENLERRTSKATIVEDQTKSKSGRTM